MQAFGRLISRSSSRKYATTPWFVDPEPFVHRVPPPHLSHNPLAPPLPQGTPDAVRQLHEQLKMSPHLEPSTLIVTQTLEREMGPPLPLRKPQGRRKRGGTYAGESAFDVPGGLWNWLVLAQVKEGAENKGGIESVVRLIRKTLLGMTPPLPLSPNSKKRMHNGWALVDAGDFAVHVLSRQAKERYFGNRGDQW